MLWRSLRRFQGNIRVSLGTVAAETQGVLKVAHKHAGAGASCLGDLIGVEDSCLLACFIGGFLTDDVTVGVLHCHSAVGVIRLNSGVSQHTGEHTLETA